MKNLDKNRFKQIYSIFISIVTIIIGMLFVYHILSIYIAGSNEKQIYTREIVITHLIQMIIPLIILFVLIIVGEIFYKILSNNKKLSCKISNTELVKLSIKKINLNDYKDDIKENIYAIKKAEKVKLIGKIIVGIICLGSSLFALFYLLDKNNFVSNNPNGSIITMALWFLPFIILSLASIAGYTYFEEKISKKEYENIKIVIAFNRKNNIEIKKEKSRKLFNILKSNEINIARLIILVVSVTFIVVGLFNGDPENVLKKAIMICSECIGLG